MSDNETMGNSIETRNLVDLQNAFSLADTVLLKKYINDIHTYPIRCAKKNEEGGQDKEKAGDSEPFVDEKINNIVVGDNVCLYRVGKIVYDKTEAIHDKLVTVYSSVCAEKKAALVVLLKGTTEQVELYMGVALKEFSSAGGIDETTRNELGESFEGILKGHFPGTKIDKVQTEDVVREGGQEKKICPRKKLIDDCFKSNSTIATVSGIAALRSDGENKNETFVQGMEKLIDSMRGKEYTAIYIADTVESNEAETLCAHYEDLYAVLSPFKQSVHTVNENNTVTNTEGMIKGIVDTTNDSISKAVSYGTIHSVSSTNSAGVAAGGKVVSVNYQHSNTKTEGTQKTDTDTQTSGKAKSLVTQNSVAQAIARGKGEALQTTHVNRAVQTLLDRIDEQIKRLRSCEDFGLFNSCVYFVGKRADVVAAAGTYKSLIRGENSSVESSAINIWTEKEDVELLSVYLKRFYHPVFGMPKSQVEQAADKGLEYYDVTPAQLVSGKELAYQFSLPKRSVGGVTVVDMAAFGRNVYKCGDNDEKPNGAAEHKIDLGNLYHMGQEDENTHISLNADSLTKHTFVTGSTGVGKSNTVYTMLDALKTKKIKFLVVEPAKGEYKDKFEDNVRVYGTNPKRSELLRINPFSFPDGIHVYEHIDRLVEIFNVCWPMYAAMPAVLKDAIERAYTDAGWDLLASENRYREDLFPTFGDVLRQIDIVINASQYSADSKGDYKGALSTRLRSLTNGINGMIFTANELSTEELFEENVIVDISRVGSTETKSLIMGLLVMKLQEHRMTQDTNANAPLKHVTVLEEAHHLLRRTSSEQSSDSANLVGKSVEMITNAIAEMRTYGEGFIIADQAPGLLDMAVIRNTNTKIIMRLPEYSDRELVGKAAGLNDKQIEELARLGTGVAAVYQNDWIEAVLCKVKEFKKEPRGNTKNTYSLKQQNSDDIHRALFLALAKNTLDKFIERFTDRGIITSDLPATVKCGILEYKESEAEKHIDELAAIAYEYLCADKLVAEVDRFDNGEQWMQHVKAAIAPFTTDCNEREIAFIITMIVSVGMQRHPEKERHIYELYTEGRIQ